MFSWRSVHPAVDVGIVDRQGHGRDEGDDDLADERQVARLGEAGIIDLDQTPGEQEGHRLAFRRIGEGPELNLVFDQARVDAVGHDLQPEVQAFDRFDDVGRHSGQAGDAGQLFGREARADQAHRGRDGQAHPGVDGGHVRQGLQGLDRGVIQGAQPARSVETGLARHGGDAVGVPGKDLCGDHPADAAAEGREEDEAGDADDDADAGEDKVLAVAADVLGHEAAELAGGHGRLNSRPSRPVGRLPAGRIGWRCGRAGLRGSRRRRSGRRRG